MCCAAAASILDVGAGVFPNWQNHAFYLFYKKISILPFLLVTFHHFFYPNIYAQFMNLNFVIVQIIHITFLSRILCTYVFAFYTQLMNINYIVRHIYCILVYNFL